MIKNIKEKLVGATGSLSGAASILGSWNVCHNVCLGIIAVLGLIGITITGMPLLFLTKVAIPFWIIAVILFVIILYFYFKKHCISKTLIFINSGLIIAGTPFEPLQTYQLYFWIVGGALVIMGILFFIIGRRKHGN